MIVVINREGLTFFLRRKNIKTSHYLFKEDEENMITKSTQQWTLWVSVLKPPCGSNDLNHGLLDLTHCPNQLVNIIEFSLINSPI